MFKDYANTKGYNIATDDVPEGGPSMGFTLMTNVFEDKSFGAMLERGAETEAEGMLMLMLPN